MGQLTLSEPGSLRLPPGWHPTDQRPALSPRLASLLACAPELPHGLSLFACQDGRLFEGRVESGCRKSFGRMYLKEAVIVGEFLEFEPVTEVAIVCAKGLYEGGVRLNQPQGSGTFHFRSGLRVWSEAWRESRPNGQCVESWPNGDRFIGRMSEGVKDGEGKYFSRKYNFCGRFSNGQMAQGQLKLPAYTFIGQFRENSPAEGLVLYPNGDTFQGQLNKGRREGRGTFKFAGGDTMQGVWQSDRFIGPAQQRVLSTEQGATECQHKSK